MVTRGSKRSYFDMLDAFKVTTCKHLLLKSTKLHLRSLLKKSNLNLSSTYTPTPTLFLKILCRLLFFSLQKKSFGIEGLMKISRMSTSAEHYVGRDRVHVQLGFRGLPPASEELPLAAARS